MYRNHTRTMKHDVKQLASNVRQLGAHAATAAREWINERTHDMAHRNDDNGQQSRNRDWNAQNVSHGYQNDSYRGSEYNQNESMRGYGEGSSQGAQGTYGVHQREDSDFANRERNYGNQWRDEGAHATREPQYSSQRSGTQPQGYGAPSQPYGQSDYGRPSMSQGDQYRAQNHGPSSSLGSRAYGSQGDGNQGYGQARETSYGQGYGSGDDGSQGYGTRMQGSQGYGQPQNSSRGATYGQQDMGRGYVNESSSGLGQGYGQSSGYSQPSGYGQGTYGTSSGYGMQQGHGGSNPNTDASTRGNFGASSYGAYGQGAGYRGKGPKGYARSDARIQEDLNERLFHDDEIDASDLELSVKDGVVTLDGTITERRLKYRVEDIAESCSGVKDVTNNLRVQSSLSNANATYGSTTASQSGGSLGGSDTGVDLKSTGTKASTGTRGNAT